MPLDAARLNALANVVGTHALTSFGVALTVLLLVVGSAWLIVHRRYVRRHHAPDLADARALTVTLLFAFVAIATAALLFATLPHYLRPDHPLALADQALTDAVRRSTSASTLQVFATITVLANTPVQWAVAIVGALVLLWRRDRFLAIFWITAIAGNGILNRLLKATFERARPALRARLICGPGVEFSQRPRVRCGGGLWRPRVRIDPLDADPLASADRVGRNRNRVYHRMQPHLSASALRQRRSGRLRIRPRMAFGLRDQRRADHTAPPPDRRAHCA